MYVAVSGMQSASDADCGLLNSILIMALFKKKQKYNSFVKSSFHLFCIVV